MSFADLKRKSQSNFDFLQKELQKSTNANSSGDDRLWKPALDASGNGYAVVRFLPAPEGESLPWAKLYNHAFQGPGGWLIDNCPTTKGEQCPVCAANNKLWNSGVESDKEIARNRKRKLSYYSNIYVLKDSANPENEGKVFLYKYGKKIHDKIVSSMQPQFEDEEPINPFDLWSGADFRIKIQTIGGYWNYDKSDFAAPSTLGGFDDEKLEALWKSQHSLKEFTDPSAFKSYEKLEERLNLVLNKGRTQVRTRDEQDEAVFDSPVGGFNDRDITPVAPVSQPDTTPSGFGAKIEELNKADDGPDLDYFAALANDD